MITSDMDPNIAPPMANIRRTKKPLNPGRDSQAFGSNGAPRSPPLITTLLQLRCLVATFTTTTPLVAFTPSLHRRCYAAPSLPIFFAISSCLSHSSSLTFHKEFLEQMTIRNQFQITLPFARVEVEKALPEVHQDGREIKTSVKQDAKPGLNQEGKSSSRGEAQVTLKPLSGNS
ncbi:hypothetical protein B296_00051590 [Ensete ventricosum]|uniref:Uncharacterized protein n=1 Tax=Ensete ventricosum TaxID=4639 RepID=A0A426YG55_ENSVE|nr:hypothetical protein B296_00051590 [Ensete ventricosum]